MNKPQLLIVGINNFLGKAIYELVNERYAVTGIYHVNRQNIPAGVEAIYVDDLPGLKDRNFDHIYLISSYVPGSNMVINDDQLIQSNILLPKQISLLFPASKIIFCSSVSVFENFDHTGNRSKYAISKLWGERIIEDHAAYAILRISSMYGIGMKDTTFIPRIIEDAIQKRHITLLGDGQRLQNYINVEDVANIAVKLAQLPKNALLLAASEKSYTNIEIAEMILAIVPGRLNFSGTDNSASKVYDIDEIYQLLGKIKFKAMKDGLRELVEWMKKEF